MRIIFKAALLGMMIAPSLQAQDLNLAIAASLQDAVAAMKNDIAAELPGTKVNVSAAGSGAIQQQISQGAPIDVFLSAAARPIQELEKQKLLTPGTLKVFLTNDLVLIAPEASTLKSRKELTHIKVKRIAIGEPRTVPAGEYAIESLSHLQLNETLKAKFILAKDVRQVLSYVARGEVEAGFVYKSDMESAAAKGAKIIEDIPRENHKPIEYFLSVIAGSKQQDKAKKLLSYFEGPKAAVIWKKFGFRTPSEKAATAVEPTPFKGKVSAPN